MISDVCELYKLLYNPLRMEMLRRVYDSRDGINVGLLVDEMTKHGIKQSCVSQYLKQLEGVGVIVRRRVGKYANYFADCSNAPANVRNAVREIMRYHDRHPRYDVGPVLGVLMNPFRAAVVRAVANAGRMSGPTICVKFAHQPKYLKRDLQAAVDAGLFAMDDSEEPVYRFVPPSDTVTDKLIALCH